MERISGHADSKIPLKTVTYGLTSSSYQAIRCLQQLGIENEKSHPLAYNAIMNCFYVDDVLFGANSTTELKEIANQLKTVLAQGGFQLSKWCANCPEVLNETHNLQPLTA